MNSILNPTLKDESEELAEVSLRPKSFEEMIGREREKKILLS